jgi:putative ABC transport system permease protein
LPANTISHELLNVLWLIAAFILLIARVNFITILQLFIRFDGNRCGDIIKFADHEYVQAYKLQLVAGRNLKPSALTREFLVNESLVKSLGLKNPQDILNKEISIWGDVIKCPVVGVLKDFNDRSFRHDLAPLLITTNNTMYNQAGVKLAGTNISATLQSVKTIFEQTFPDFVYEYKFLDDKIESGC